MDTSSSGNWPASWVRLAAEAAALASDEADRAEIAAVTELMEDLRAP